VFIAGLPLGLEWGGGGWGGGEKSVLLKTVVKINPYKFVGKKKK